jgi:hypothetical protein
VPKLIQVPLDEQTTIFLETSDVLTGESDPMFAPASGSKIIAKTKGYLDDVLFQVKLFSSSIADSIRNISDEVEVEFSVKLAADAGIVISSVSTEASITVKLKWNKEAK